MCESRKREKRREKKMEDGRWKRKAELGKWKTEDGCQKTEERRQGREAC